VLLILVVTNQRAKHRRALRFWPFAPPQFGARPRWGLSLTQRSWSNFSGLKRKRLKSRAG